MMFDIEQGSYKRFRKIYAERTISVVLWIGSGLSVPAGLPTWRTFRDNLIAEGRAKARTFEANERKRLLGTLDALERISDYWTAFDRLKTILGDTTFRASVREALTPSPDTSCPEEYCQLWKLRIGGMLTLNLDRFAARSYAQEHGDLLHEMTGKACPKKLHLLKSSRPFVVNLHGIVEDADSWVLTRSDLAALFKIRGYTLFIETLFSTRTILFLGVNATDRAAGGFLSRLRDQGIETGSHFWLTSKTDRETDNWAEQNGIEVIRFPVETSHESVFAQIFQDLSSYTSRDAPATPIQPPERFSLSEVAIPTPSNLAGYDPEQIRLSLARKANEILTQDEPGSVERYAEFCKEYQRAIFNSWFVGTEEPDNLLFGNRVLEKVGEGAFARVYRAISSTGESVAIKLIRPEVGQDETMLGCFRRGVRSMQILSERKVQGMVPYREAYELPACAIMEFIEGPNLQEAVENSLLDAWQDGLRIAIDIARIVRQGHLLPEQVLHRDIRPANIMLKNFYTGDPWVVVVLDFDLSWHRGAPERSMELKDPTALGYLAPEQIERLEGVSTRNAAVDAFGIGMTILFLFTGRHPTYGESKRERWEYKVRDRLKRLPKTEWASIRTRLARLIARATEPVQSKRIDYGEIVFELENLQNVWRSPDKERSAELWAEEILERSFGEGEYIWNNDKLEGRTTRPSGLEITIQAREVESAIDIRVGWATRGQYDRKNVGKYLPARVDQIASALKSAGWRITGTTLGKGNFSLSGRIAIEVLVGRVTQTTNALSTAGELLEF